MSDKAAEAAAGDAPPKAKPPLALLVVLINTLALLGAMGYLYYTRMIYKRPAITETEEREKLEKQHIKRVRTLNPGQMNFESMTINIRDKAPEPANADGSAPAAPSGTAKLRYVTLSFTLETRNEDLVETLTPFKAKIVDRVISIIGRKSYYELTTVQGRYLVRTQITDAVNDLLESIQKKKDEEWEAPLTNVYFNQFTVQ
jgi:flagellar basal body-associated protein FliL